MKGALVAGTIAKKGDDNVLGLFAQFQPVGDANGNGKGFAHDGIAAHKAAFGIEQVHGTSHAVAAAGFLAKQFGHDGTGGDTAHQRVHMLAVGGD